MLNRFQLVFVMLGVSEWPAQNFEVWNRFIISKAASVFILGKSTGEEKHQNPKSHSKLEKKHTQQMLNSE